MGSWIAVQSTNLARVRYEPESMAMDIEFQGGRVYRYFDVPQAIFDSLLGAVSKGSYFAESIRGTYRYARM